MGEHDSVDEDISRTNTKLKITYESRAGLDSLLRAARDQDQGSVRHLHQNQNSVIVYRANCTNGVKVSCMV